MPHAAPTSDRAALRSASSTRPPGLSAARPPPRLLPRPDDEGGTAELRDQLDAGQPGLPRREGQARHLGEAPEGSRRGGHQDRSRARHPQRGARRARRRGLPHRSARSDDRAAQRQLPRRLPGPRRRAGSRSPPTRTANCACSTRPRSGGPRQGRDRPGDPGAAQAGRHMAARKKQAERALRGRRAAARRSAAPSGDGGADADARATPTALAGESCSINDPTTSGCITPRTAARAQAGQGGGIHAVRVVLPQRRIRRAPQGPRVRLRGAEERVRRRRHRRRPDVRQQPRQRTSCATPASSACCT